MDRRVGHRDDKDQITEEAAEWVIRLGSPSFGDLERSSFERWLSQGREHARAFERAQAIWTELEALRHAPGCLAADLRPSRVDSNRAVAGLAAARATRKPLWMAAGMAAICLVATGAASSFWYGNPMVMMAADYRTAPGEQQTVTLPDGSVVDLSSRSAIALHFTDKERRVELLEGAAYFKAAPRAGEETRPFVVEGAEGTVTALGTQFVVDRLSEAVEVAVVEHEVRVALKDTGNGAASTVLTPGQSVRYSLQDGLGHVEETNVELAAAWRQGKLIFDQVPLSDVVAELNRYRRGRIVIADSGLAKRTVSGVFDTKDLDRALVTITQELRIQSASVPPLVTLLY